MGGTKYPNFRQDWRCNHNVTSSDLADVAFFDPSTGSFLKKCDKARYMAMTDWLKGLLGLQMVGPEMLAGFFQTNLLSVRRNSALIVGGFDESVAKYWGYEDAECGARLLARDLTFVPCPSAVAFKVQHSERRPKTRDAAANRVYVWTTLRTGKTSTTYSQRGLIERVTELRPVEVKPTSSEKSTGTRTRDCEK